MDGSNGDVEGRDGFDMYRGMGSHRAGLDLSGRMKEWHTAFGVSCLSNHLDRCRARALFLRIHRVGYGLSVFCGVF